MDQPKDDHPPPLPIEPGHVMSKEKYEQLVKAQQK